MGELLRRGRSISVAAVVGLVVALLVLPRPAAAEQARPADGHTDEGYWLQVRPAGDDSEPIWLWVDGAAPRQVELGACDSKERNRLAELGSGHLVCVQYGLPSDETEAYLSDLEPADDVSSLGNVPPPDWCLDYDRFGTWHRTRTQQCRASNGRLDVFHLQTGALLATVLFIEVAYLFTSSSIPNWNFQIDILPTAMVGATGGTTVSGISPGCTSCQNIQADFSPQPVLLGSSAGGSASFTTSVPASGPVGYSESYWIYHFQNPAWVGGTSTSEWVEAPWDVRCDSITPGPIGCVVADQPPTHYVSLTGSTPTYAAHIAEAQASGLPGSRLGGPLHRLMDAASIHANRVTACPPSWPRPTDFSCDEYPFASTWEGAYMGAGGAGGRTFQWCQVTQLPTGVTGAGYSSCMIPELENITGGSRLGSFFNSERVLDEEAFYVEVIP